MSNPVPMTPQEQVDYLMTFYDGFQAWKKQK